MREPTADQCSTGEAVDVAFPSVGFAAWYPQMGGYSGKCVVVVRPGQDGSLGCFDVVVWHDGMFPFSENGSDRDGEERGRPAGLHHCQATQFIRFGLEVAESQAGLAGGDLSQAAQDFRDLAARCLAVADLLATRSSPG